MCFAANNLLICNILYFTLTKSYGTYNVCLFQGEKQIPNKNTLVVEAAKCCYQQDCEGILIKQSRNGSLHTSLSEDYLPFVKRLLTFRPPVEAGLGGASFLLAGGFRTNRELMIKAEPLENWKHIAVRLFERSKTVMRVDMKENKDGWRHMVLIESQDVKETTDKYWRNVEPPPADPFPFKKGVPFQMSFVSKPGHIEVWVGKELYSRYNVSFTAGITKSSVYAQTNVHEFTYTDWNNV